MNEISTKDIILQQVRLEKGNLKMKERNLVLALIKKKNETPAGKN